VGTFAARDEAAAMAHAAGVRTDLTDPISGEMEE
jgi:hypothetical protein